MIAGNAPKQPKCPLGRLIANQMDTDEVKRRGWLDNSILVVSIHDDSLTWADREMVKQIGEKLYGKIPADKF